MLVRSATDGDFDVVTRLLEDLNRPVVTADLRADARAVYEAQVADPAADHLVAEDDDGQVVGFCSLHFRGRLNEVQPQGWIPDLIVAEAARRQGIASALLREAEARAVAHGCNDLTLESSFHREDAHRLYQALGYEKPGFFFGKGLG